jgi:hypothetical protein
MDNELPDFAGESTPAPADIQTQEPVAQPAPAQQEAPATPPVVEPAQPAPVAPVEPPVAQHVPLSTFLDMRDKAAANEKRAKELEAWRQQQEAQARRQPAPDPTEDLVGFQQHQAQQFHGALYAQSLTFSRRMAEMQHGPDVTKTAFEWGAARCDQDPFFNEKVRASQDPVGLVVEEWKREQLLSKLDPTDLEAFQAWKAGQAANPATLQQAAVAQQAAARPAAPRASLAAAPSAGASADPRPLDGEETYTAMFGT